MFERFYQPDPEDTSSQTPGPGEHDPQHAAPRRLRFEEGHALPTPMFIRLKSDPPRDN